MQFLLSIALISLILWSFKRLNFAKNSGISNKELSFLFLIKLLFGFALYVIYTQFYTDRSTADIFKYYDDAELLYQQLLTSSPNDYFKIILGIQGDDPQIISALRNTHFWFKPFDTGVFNDNRTIIRINMVIRLFSFGAYHLHAIVFCLMSFLGSLAIYKCFYSVFTSKKWELLIACFLIPSLLLWASSILKESVLIFGIGGLLLSFTRLLHSNKKRIANVILFTLSILLLSITKTYVLLILVPSLIAWLLIVKWKIKHVHLTFLISYGVCILFAFNAYRIAPKFDLGKILQKKQLDFINVARDTKAGSAITVTRLDGSFISCLKNSPEALANCIFRPLPWESNSIFALFASFENVVIILLIILAGLYSKKPTDEQKPYLYFSFYFVVLLALLIGLTVPVLGAIVRYKVPAMIFLVSFLLLCIDKEKLLLNLKRIIK